jgi:hypothetical protein
VDRYVAIVVAPRSLTESRVIVNLSPSLENIALNNFGGSGAVAELRTMIVELTLEYVDLSGPATKDDNI